MSIRLKDTIYDLVSNSSKLNSLAGDVYMQYKTATIPATAGWYRIAQTSSGISNNLGIFHILASTSSYHTNVTLSVGTSYGNSAGTTIQQISCSTYSNPNLTKARIVYNTSYSGNYAYLEVYHSVSSTNSISVKFQGHGWQLIAPNTAGSIPSGYSNKEITFAKNAMIATSFKGNADTATKLETARTISLTGSVTGSGSFDGSGNLSIATTTNHSHSTLTIQGNGTSLGTYNGSADKTFNITYSNVGAAASSHTHNYAGSNTSAGKAYDLYGHSGNPGSHNNVGVRWFTMSSTNSGSSGYARTNAGFPVSNNANGMLWLGNHSGPYGGQLGISSNGRLYYRFISNGSFPTTANGGSWNRIAWTGDLSSYVTVSGTQTISGKKTFSGGAAITSASENTSMPFFLGIDAFADGGTIKYISKGSICSCIGAAAASHTHSYIPLSGGTLSSGTARISRAGSSVSWYQGRSNAMMYISSYSGYNAIASMKTTNGDWSLGVYTNNYMYFTYITDTNYNSGTNTTTCQFIFRPDGYIQGNLSGYATSAGNADTVDGYHASSFALSSHTHNYAAASHTHNYAGSASAGGSANSAVKLDSTSVGGLWRPVYFSGGKPVACNLQFEVLEVYCNSSSQYNCGHYSGSNIVTITSVTYVSTGKIKVATNLTYSSAMIWDEQDYLMDQQSPDT